MKKISVITPSFNSEQYIARAIESVINQEYENYEHIIIDGLSKDNTINIVQQYSNITYVSEKDNGQSDAMNKGFKLATGEIIVYLNSDDFFEPGIFHLINQEFTKDTDIIFGNVRIQNDKGSNVKKPSIKYTDMLEHWRYLYPLNPVQYFYKKSLQENTIFNENNHLAMDHEFLLSITQNANIKYIDKVFGIFDMVEGSKTIENTKNPIFYWSSENFDYVNEYLKQMPAEYIIEFKRKQTQFFETEYKSFYNRIEVSLIKNAKKNLLEALDKLSIYFLKNQNIIIYGAGTQTDCIYPLIQDKINYLIDKKTDTVSNYQNHHLYHPNQIKHESAPVIFVTPLNYKEEIQEYILSLNKKSQIIFLEDFLKSMSDI